MRGLGALLPKRWPTRAELATHAQRMLLAHGFGSVAPTMLGTPDIRDQLGTSCCFGFAVAQAIHIRRQVLGIPSALVSPMLPYYEARRLEVGSDAEVQDSGSDPYGMITALADFGACPWDAAPFDPAQINKRPGGEALLQAQSLQCKLDPILETGSNLWAAVQYAIGVEKKPVVWALEVVPGFDHPTNGIVSNAAGESRGLHANMAFGINEDGAIDANSWGTSYGSNGTVVMTPSFIGARIVWAGSLDIETPEAA